MVVQIFQAVSDAIPKRPVIGAFTLTGIVKSVRASLECNVKQQTHKHTVTET